MNSLVVAFLGLSVVGTSLSAQSAPTDSGHVRIDLLAADSVVKRALPGGLQLRIETVPHARAAHFGWFVRVVGPRTGPGQTLLQPPLPPHGPHPADLLAWTAREHYYPDERRFSVRVPCLEIVARLSDYTTAADSTASWFTSGTLEVSWRRIKRRPCP
jgi:hypothetical protein